MSSKTTQSLNRASPKKVKTKIRKVPSLLNVDDTLINKTKLPSIESNIIFEWNASSVQDNLSELEIKRNNLLTIMNNPIYSTVRQIVLPYTSLKSRFFYQDALKLAEMDMIYKVCPRNPILTYVPSLIAYSFSQRINTADLGGGPGGFLEYVQFRYPSAITGGMTKRISSQDDGWDLSKIDAHRLIRYPGEDYSGDILSQWLPFIEMLQGQFVETLEFISASGTKTTDKPDLMAWIELYIILVTIQDGANAILRLETTWSQMMMEVIYVATQTFDQVYLFQPLVSGSDSNEIFLVLKNALSERKEYFASMSKLMSRIPDINKIKSILSSPLPEQFVDTIEQKKKEFLMIQTETLSEIQNHFYLNHSVEKKMDDIQLKLAQWALPDAYS